MCWRVWGRVDEGVDGVGVDGCGGVVGVGWVLGCYSGGKIILD